MRRDILKRIFDWNKSHRRKPLVLMGARQVGKTWLMNAFAQEAYPSDTVYVNLMKMKTLRNSLETSDLSPSALLERIRVALDADITPGKTLLVLDETKTCRISLSLRQGLFWDSPLGGRRIVSRQMGIPTRGVDRSLSAR